MTLLLLPCIDITVISSKQGFELDYAMQFGISACLMMSLSWEWLYMVIISDCVIHKVGNLKSANGYREIL